jgi:adenylosuccinate synthase
VTCYIGNGVVLSVAKLFEEIEGLEKAGVEVRSRLRISEACPLILPFHAALDVARGLPRAGRAGKIGTTGRGIGPAYEDKIARRALRVQDRHPERFAQKLKVLLTLHNHVLTQLLNAPAVDYQTVYDEAMRHAEFIRPMIADVSRELNEANQRGANLLFEGAQGTLLDVDHGTYPYVTSSNCVAGNAAAGSGVGPGLLHYVLGITKAYCTRVGGGPFPTELDWKRPAPSATTCPPSAPRWASPPGGRAAAAGSTPRCSSAAPRSTACRACASPSWTCWTACRSSSCAPATSWTASTSTAAAGRRRDRALQAHLRNHGRLERKHRGRDRLRQLPVAARLYLQRIEHVTGVPIHLVSTSPDREHTIMMRHPFLAD